MEKVLWYAVPLLSFCLSWAVRAVTIRAAILDVPNHRSSHSIPTPLGGGIAIAITWYAALTWLFVEKKLSADLYGAFSCGLILCVSGFIDDAKGLHMRPKLVCQVFATAGSLFFLGGVASLNFGFLTVRGVWLCTALAFAGIMWMTNLFNFLDGIDGFAALEAVFVGLAIFLIFRSPLGLVLALACTGFLCWNWQRASLFMGDAGSTFLGFTIAILGLFLQANGSATLLDLGLLTAVFWFDATVTLARRCINRENICEAHRKHAFQRIVLAGFSHQKTVLIAMLINAALVALVLAERSIHWFMIPAAGLALFMLCGIMMAVDKKNPFKRG